jgi:hypothetical protein
MTTNESITEKIRKLLAIADKSSGATENEMMVAMEMAQMLMIKHAIDENALARPVVPGIKRVDSPDEYDLWAIDLAGSAARLNLAKMVYTRHGSEVTFQYIGRPEAIVASQAMTTQLVREVERLYKLNLPRGLTKSARAEYRRNFKFAASVRIGQRIDQMVLRMKTDGAYAARTGSTALVVSSTIDQRLREIEEWIKANMRVRTVMRKAKTGGFGTMHGYNAGDQATIRQGLGQSSAPFALPKPKGGV